MANFTGDENDNAIFGTDEADLIKGLGGDDNLYGLRGDDTLLGGDGNDNLSGGEGRDTLDGGAGADDFVSEGVDAIDGGSGQDEAGFSYFFATTDLSFVLTDSATPATVQGNGTTVVNVEAITFFGGSGNDRVETLDGEDGLYGRRGADTLSGGGGNDLIEGGQGLDNLSGGKGDDFLEGAQGRDVLDGGRGDDALEGGSTQRSDFDDATDTFRFEGNFGKDKVYEFQDGSDRLLFVGYAEDDLTVSRSGETVTLTLDNGTKSGTVTILGFEGTFNASDYDFA